MDEVTVLREALVRERAKAEQVTQPQTLLPYMEACHRLSLALRVAPNPLETTAAGSPAAPAGQVYPQRIVAWPDFEERQEEIWDELLDLSLLGEARFPSPHQLDYVASLVAEPLRSTSDLARFERDTVEVAVHKMMDALAGDDDGRDHLGLDALEGSIAYERDGDHTCVSAVLDGAYEARVAIQYLSPHTLAPDEVLAGLEFEIQPARDIIDQTGAELDADFASRALAAAAITKLFSFMIHKGVQFGYITTGQAYVFVFVPADPRTIYYYVGVPRDDVGSHMASGFYRTAVSQVFAFVLQSLRAVPLQAWDGPAGRLDVWPENFDDVQRRIARSRRKARPSLDTAAGASASGAAAAGAASPPKQPPVSLSDRPYCSHRCLFGLANSGPLDPLCPNAASHGARHPSPSMFLRLLRAQLAAEARPTTTTATATTTTKTTKTTSTSACAVALCTHAPGAMGALFKVGLLGEGYTVVAKAVEAVDAARLEHEKQMYDQLYCLQGMHVPVCLGRLDLTLPFYHGRRVYKHLLLLSWAGEPLSQLVGQIDEAPLRAAVTEALLSIHGQQVLHGNARAETIMYAGRPMLVDFERARELAVYEPQRQRPGSAGSSTDSVDSADSTPSTNSAGSNSSRGSSWSRWSTWSTWSRWSHRRRQRRKRAERRQQATLCDREVRLATQSVADCFGFGEEAGLGQAGEV